MDGEDIEARVLDLLGDVPQRAADLARWLDVDAPTIYGALVALEARGRVDIVRDDSLGGRLAWRRLG